MFDALSVPDFRLLLLGNLVSSLGSYLLVVAVPYHVFQLTGSTTATALTLAAESLPALLVGPVAGVFVDRWDQRRVMIAMDVVSAVALVGIPLADRPDRVGWLYLALAVENLGMVFFRPAARALLPAVVGTGPLLAGANSLIAVNNGVVRLAGPPLGAVLLTWFGLPTLVLIDLASYLVSAAAITMTTRRAIRTGTDPVRTGRTGAGLVRSVRTSTGFVRGLWMDVGSARTARTADAARAVPLRAGFVRTVSGVVAELVAGLRFVAGHRTLRGLLLVSTIFFSANAVFTALLIPFMTVRFGSHPGVIGAQLSALGAGYLIGGPLAGRLVRDRAPRLALVLGLVGVGACFAVLANATTVLVAVLATGAAGLPGSLLLVTIETTIQRRSPDSLRGRTGAVFFASDALAALVGALIGAVSGGDGRLGTVLTASAGVIVLCAGLAAAIVPVPTFFSAEFAAQRPGTRSVSKSPGRPGI